MIFIHDKIYAKVWKVDKKEKYIDLQATTSEKDSDGNYINSGWFPRLIGHAFNSLKDKIKEGDRLIITKSKMTNERYTAQDGTTKSAFKFVVLEAEIEEPRDSTSAAPVQSAPAQTTAAATATNDTCPW